MSFIHPAKSLLFGYWSRVMVKILVQQWTDEQKKYLR